MFVHRVGSCAGFGTTATTTATAATTAATTTTATAFACSFAGHFDGRCRVGGIRLNGWFDALDGGQGRGGFHCGIHRLQDFCGSRLLALRLLRRNLTRRTRLLRLPLLAGRDFGLRLLLRLARCFHLLLRLLLL
jgi:hypothetical protein